MSFRAAVAFITWLLLIAGCATNPRAEDLSSVQRQKLAKIEVFSSTPDRPYRSMGTVKGLSCHRNQYQVANTTDAEALQGIRINAAKLGADAVINTFCQTNSTIDWRNNCWASITCVGEAIRFIDDTSANPSASPSQASQPWKRPEPKLSNDSRDDSASGQEPALLEAPQSGLKPDFVPAVILSVTRLGLKTDVPEGTTSITLEPGSYRVELLGSDDQITTVNVPLEAGKRHQVAYRILSDKSIRPVLYRVLPTRSGPPGVFATSPDTPDGIRAVGAELVSTGTAFYISSDGHLITNNHVVTECTYIRVQLPSGSVEASLQAASILDDLAVLQTAANSPKAIAKFRPTAVLLGEDVLVAGYPLSGYLSSSLNVSTGSVSSLAGLTDDRRLFQFTAPVQAGNSGGPILDESGQILGVVTSTLNPLFLARETGNIPQNVNFGIKAAVVRAFLEVHDFVPPLGSEKPRPQTRVMLAKQAGDFTVLVECWR